MATVHPSIYSPQPVITTTRSHFLQVNVVEKSLTRFWREWQELPELTEAGQTIQWLIIFVHISFH
jgi:hypothetical protein